MKIWQEIALPPTATIMQAINVIDSSGCQLAIVLDKNGRLLGTITDGDVRRGILRNVSLNESVRKIYNSNPVVATVDDSKEKVLKLMKKKKLRQIPIVNAVGKLVGLETIDNVLQWSNRDNAVVLMAGGLGTRLHPITEKVPKVLLDVGGKPILENILENFINYGFENFYLAVNYKAEMIKDYFGDGAKWDVNIKYLCEEKRLGTAGAIRLLPKNINSQIIVMNGDVLTKVNFQNLLDFHAEHNSYATMCVSEYNFQIPYGVVKVDKHRLIGINEKPNESVFVNAGIYVLEPEVIKYIPRNTFFDMPSLFKKIIDRDFETAVFPLREYWLDIGRKDDFEKAALEFTKIF